MADLAKLIIVLDTNVLQQDFQLLSGRFQVVFEFAEKTGAVFALPQIVHDEILANFGRTLTLRRKEVERAMEHLNGVVRDRVAMPPLPSDAASTPLFRTQLLRRLGLREEDVHPYSHEVLTDAIARAVGRRAPCTDRGEEVRDAVLWGSILEIAQAASKPVCFVSQNTKQFATQNGELLPELAAEALARGVKINYYSSLEAFAREHATPISFINAEWIEQQVSQDEVLESVLDAVMEGAHEAAYEREGRHVDIEGGFHLSGGGVSVDEFFVNDLGDGTLRIEVRWYGSPDVEYEVRESYDRLGSSWASARSEYRPISRHEVEVRVEVVTQLLVKGQRVTEWSVVECSVKS